jgi:hypothetical protein
VYYLADWVVEKGLLLSAKYSLVLGLYVLISDDLYFFKKDYCCPIKNTLKLHANINIINKPDANTWQLSPNYPLNKKKLRLFRNGAHLFID